MKRLVLILVIAGLLVSGCSAPVGKETSTPTPAPSAKEVELEKKVAQLEREVAATSAPSAREVGLEKKVAELKQNVQELSESLAASSARETQLREKRPSIDPIAEETAEFWAAARPIVEQQVAEFGRPLAELAVELGPQMASGHPTAYSQWIGELQERRQHLAQAFLQLSELNPPPGIAARWHQAQLTAWGMRLEAVDIMVANWDFDQHLFVGSEEDAWLGNELWIGAMLGGQDADRLQAELIQWLADSLGEIRMREEPPEGELPTPPTRVAVNWEALRAAPTPVTGVVAKEDVVPIQDIIARVMPFEMFVRYEPSFWQKAWDIPTRLFHHLGKAVRQYERHVQDPVFGWVAAQLDPEGEAAAIYRILREDTNVNWWMAWSKAYDMAQDISPNEKLMMRMVSWLVILCLVLLAMKGKREEREIEVDPLLGTG